MQAFGEREPTGGRAAGARGLPARAPRRGPAGAGRKYDILTALAAAGLAKGGAGAVSALRLVALLTARYDWTADRITVGHEEAARLWATSTRTAKREMARLMEQGLLVRLERGVRGRVGAYRLDPAAVRARTYASWPQAGRDFEARMEAELLPAPEVVRAGGASRSAPAGGTVWPALYAALAEAQPERAAVWFARLSEDGFDGATLVLRAETAFVAEYVATHLAGSLRQALAMAMGPGAELTILPPTG